MSVQFLARNGKPQKLPLQGQAVSYFGREVERFLARLGTFGLCVALIWKEMRNVEPSSN